MIQTPSYDAAPRLVGVRPRVHSPTQPAVQLYYSFGIGSICIPIHVLDHSVLENQQRRSSSWRHHLLKKEEYLSTPCLVIYHI